MLLPASIDLPQDSGLAPRRALEPSRPIVRSYAAILAHPVFAPDRAAAAVEVQPSGNLSGFEVLGTAIAGNVSTALVRDGTGRIIRLKPDAILQGWRLVSIDRLQLMFDRDGEQRTLTVDMSRAKVASVAHDTVTGSSRSNDDDEEDSKSSDDEDDDE